MLFRFFHDESAATGIEYGLIAALVALAIISGVGTFANSVESLFNYSTNTFQQAVD